LRIPIMSHSSTPIFASRAFRKVFKSLKPPWPGRTGSTVSPSG
jgi:hypothetical protein